MRERGGQHFRTVLTVSGITVVRLSFCPSVCEYYNTRTNKWEELHM